MIRSDTPTPPPPSRRELIMWCYERAEANRWFNGQLDHAEMRLIKREWPRFFIAIAQELQRSEDAESKP